MSGVYVTGFTCLGLTIIFFVFFMNRKLYKKVIKVIMVCAAVFTMYVGVLLVDKYIREEIRVYESIEEVFEQNYKDADISYINDGSYYYLKIDKSRTNKSSVRNSVTYDYDYELIKYENGKYTAYDKIARYSKRIKHDTLRTIGLISLNSLWSEKIVYEIDDEVIIIIRTYYDLQIYDEHGSFNYVVFDNWHYFTNIVTKDIYNDDYKIFTDRPSNTYELIEFSNLYQDYIYWEVKEE